MPGTCAKVSIVNCFYRDPSLMVALVSFFHFAGLNKKLLQAAKSTSCTAIGPWSRSLVNHLYFSVKRGDGNGDLAVAVWLSMMNHIQDKHDGHSLQYERCQHGDLEPRKWIFPGAFLLCFFYWNTFFSPVNGHLSGNLMVGSGCICTI